MKLRTEIQLKSQQENLIDHKSKILLLGSCFSENIGTKLSYFKFDTLVNPFGVIFNPVSLARLVEDSVNEKQYSREDLVDSYGLYHSLFHHSDLSAIDENEVLKNIHQAQIKCLEYLKSSSHIIITLGTAWVYEYNSSEDVVANCHKVPQKEFTKRLLSLGEIQGSLQKIEKLIKTVNSKAQVICTVSPVRHIKDGIPENNLSKSLLRVAIELTTSNCHPELVKRNPLTKYFPSYEIITDDLRDYRFYQSDLIHPNQVAIDYIWECFTKVWITKESQTFFKRIKSVQSSLLHRPFNLESTEYQQFLHKLHIKINQLEKELGITF